MSILVGKSVKQIHRYAQGKSEPPVTAVAALAAAAGVRVEWLATGRGPMRDGVAEGRAETASTPAAAPHRTDARLLSRLTERILAVYREAGTEIAVREAVERAATEHDGIVSALVDPDDRLIRAGEIIAELRRQLASMRPPSVAARPSAGEQERGPAQRPAVDQGEPASDHGHSGQLTRLE